MGDEYFRPVMLVMGSMASSWSDEIPADVIVSLLQFPVK